MCSSPRCATLPPMLLPGAQVGSHTVEADLGGGEFLVRAGDGTERTLVVLPEQAVTERDRLSLAAARALDLRPHPHLVSVHGVLDVDGRDALLIDRVEGPRLTEWLADERDLDVRERVLRQVASALSHAHARGIAHGHLDPSLVQIERRSTGPFARVHQVLHPDAALSRSADVAALGRLLALMIEGHDDAEDRHRAAIEQVETSSIPDWLRVLDGAVDDTTPPSYADWLADDTSDETSATIGRPLLLDPIGDRLWRGTWRGSQGAIRMVPEGTNEEALDRQRRILGRLNRHCFPSLLDDFKTAGSRWLVREWVAGATVADWLETHRYSKADALSLAERLLEALVWLHDADPPVSHEAIRAEHLLEGPRNRLVLLGWSSARHGADARPTHDVREAGLLLAQELEGTRTHPEISAWVESLVSEDRPTAAEALHQVRRLVRLAAPASQPPFWMHEEAAEPTPAPAPELPARELQVAAPPPPPPAPTPRGLPPPVPERTWLLPASLALAAVLFAAAMWVALT